MRKAPIVATDELRDRLEAIFAEGKAPYDISRTVERDLGKIQFDWENYDKEGTGLGYKKLPNWLPILFMYAGGDWEHPVYFVLYWDGKQIRGYIPENGNVFNKKTKAAYGNEYDFDEDEVDDKDVPEANFQLMEQDILNRIQII